MATAKPDSETMDMEGLALRVDQLQTGAGVAVDVSDLTGLDGFSVQTFDSDSDNDIAITYSAADPSITTNGAITIANGGTPTVAELLEFCEELNDGIAGLDTKLNALIDALIAGEVLAAS